MNLSNSNIMDSQKFSAYNTNYDDIIFKNHEPKLKTNKKPPQNNAALAMRHITTKGASSDEVYDEISKIFFSEANMNRVQKAIKRAIFFKSKGKFRLDEDQDESDLLVTMRAVFIEYSRFLPNKIIRQVKELNRLTVEYIIPDMITEIKQTYGYIKEINEPIKPIPRPMNVNNAGRKTLPSITTTYGIGM
jgi:hypothetical protein